MKGFNEFIENKDNKVLKDFFVKISVEDGIMLESMFFKFQALKQSEDVVLDSVSKCGKCNEPEYDFGLCFRHYCISESDNTHGC